jgi:hypothetical protein
MDDTDGHKACRQQGARSESTCEQDGGTNGGYGAGDAHDSSQGQ